MRMLFEASSHEDLMGIIRSVRRRWRLRILFRGMGVVLSAGVVAFLVSAYGMDYFRFTSTAVLLFQIATYATLIALTIRFLVLPLSQKVSDERVALYLEENEPSLQGHVTSGVQFGATVDDAASMGQSPALIKKLVRRAIEKCVEVEEGRRVERKKLAGSSGFLAGATLTGLLFLITSPGFLEHSAPFLLTPWNRDATENPYSIDVSPGSVTLARGADLRVTAHLNNFTAGEVELAVRRGEEAQWERWPMTVDDETGEYLLLLFELNEQTEYFVEASGVRSPVYRIEVADLPYVDQINLEYHFPAYTGLSPQRQENSGDIAALQGTRVELEITPTMQVAAGAIVLDDRDTLALEVTEEGLLTGTIRVQRQGLYRILLESFQGDLVVASPDYVIDALIDQPPSVSISKPGRDITVTSVEEIFTEVQAEDDYGVTQLQLIYSVNGQPEDTLQLVDGDRARKQVTASHTFFLEELELEPGDFISYYARGVEADRGSDTRDGITDIYFMDVRPFGREYRQAEQQGGMQGQGQQSGGDMGSLSRTQKDIIAGTFRMVRDRELYPEADFNENVQTLKLAQGRLREEVQTLVDRMSARGIVELDSAFASIAEELPKAVEAMVSAEEQLEARDPDEALPPERTALQHLQRAEAAYREVQVSRGQQGGGRGGQQSDAEDLADLFDLELDKMRNQYEQVQRGQQEQVDEDLDEITQKLRELARRQQQENERMRARQQNLSQAGGSGESQRRLAEEAEELARQLERLSREQSRPDLEQTARNLREAAEAMRQAAANARNNGLGQGVEALDELREARRLLDENRAASLRRDVEDALRRTRRLAADQRDVQQDVEELSSDPRTRAEQVDRLQERKAAMADEIAGIEEQLVNLSRESQSEQKDAARELDEAARSMRDNRLREKVLYSRGVIEQGSPEYARNLEGQISSDIQDLEQRIQRGLEAIGESREQRLARSLDRTRDAVNALESLEDRLRDRSQMEQGQQGQQQQGQQDQQQGQQGQQGQQQGQQGQQGQQQGQQGQKGQQQGQQQGGGGGGGNRLRPGDARQFERDLRQRLGELSELRRELQRDGVDVGGLDRVIAGLSGFERRREYGDPRGLDILESEIIQGLKDFEYDLRRELLGDEGDRLFLGGSDDVPEGYRELVEQYYRELSRRGGGGN
jgi:hypothetical protein